eukprot:TRINITY_DN10622_c0_g1_i1.p1 TRINITY_DN10622_c0_g1~~TRINITY_DN10622_c0_g1_i1.p1  ORF type:complete len:169 (-),score=29.24 TRINITY_DN10622_c0_g1_i1:94-600(-)
MSYKNIVAGAIRGITESGGLVYVSVVKDKLQYLEIIPYKVNIDISGLELDHIVEVQVLSSFFERYPEQVKDISFAQLVEICSIHVSPGANLCYVDATINNNKGKLVSSLLKNNGVVLWPQYTDEDAKINVHSYMRCCSQYIQKVAAACADIGFENYASYLAEVYSIYL